MTEPLVAGSPAPGPVTRPVPAGAGYAGGTAVAGQGSDAPVRAWLRFFRSELRLVFGRRRNQALLAVVGLFPLIIGIGLASAYLYQAWESPNPGPNNFYRMNSPVK